MRWIFGIVGLVIGALGGGTIGAFFGALIGVGLASLILYMDKRASSQWTNPPAGPEGLGPVQAPAPMPGVVPINERVTRLEHEVALLRRQLAQMQGQAFAAPVPEAAAEPAAVPVPEPVVAQALPPAQAPAVPPSAVVPEPVAPRELPPHEPDWVERAVGAARDWLLGGNSVVRVGILILFFGVAFLLKYAADNSLLPIEFRLAGVAVASIVLLGIGWRLRDKRPGYALVLQGGGVGVLYLTVFAATRMVPLLPVGAAFALLVLICALAAGLAVKQNAPALAFTGSAGGFLAPILISTGAGSSSTKSLATARMPRFSAFVVPKCFGSLMNCTAGNASSTASEPSLECRSTTTERISPGRAANAVRQRSRASRWLRETMTTAIGSTGGGGFCGGVKPLL